MAVATTRPCRIPHQTSSAVGLIGGGQVPTPREVSRAHHGVLLLDELPECRRMGSKGCANRSKTALIE
jgi:magnesium chelatase family protein